MFTPALHRQRHQFVVDYVKRKKPKKVADLGCSECNLLKQLKFRHEIDLLVGVDINGGTVKKKMHGLAPLPTDYLQPSYDQLRVELYQGSVTQKDCRLRGFDLVTSIELIEHLIPADVECFSSVVFGYMSPAAVIVSTPNLEFNALLPGLRGFRHSDHKFEWTRAEFRAWALKVCREYDYEVEFTGVGEAPLGQREQFGFCSQIGVFQRLRRSVSSNMPPDCDAEETFSYTLLFGVNYPSLQDNNILRRVLVSEVVYYVEKVKNEWIEGEPSRRDAAFTRCQAEGGERRETWPTAVNAGCCAVPASTCFSPYGEDVKNPAERRGLVVSEEDDKFDLLSVIHNERQSQHRCVAVPLEVLWSCCPKVRALSGSLNNLSFLLMDSPEVTLSQDGSAVIGNCWEQDEEEENTEDDQEDMCVSQLCHDAEEEEEEDWEANE